MLTRRVVSRVFGPRSEFFVQRQYQLPWHTRCLSTTGIERNRPPKLPPWMELFIESTKTTAKALEQTFQEELKAAQEQRKIDSAKKTEDKKKEEKSGAGKPSALIGGFGTIVNRNSGSWTRFSF